MNPALVFRAQGAPLLLTALLSTGCASITGLNGSADYGCKAPAGVRCDSVSGTYYNALQNNLPSQQPTRKPDPGSSVLPALPASQPSASLRTDAVTPASAGAALAAHPLRAQPRVLRLWYKAWEDADRDLVDQGYVYVQVDNGRWLIDHAQQRTRDAYAPVRPPARLLQQASPSAKAPDPAALPGKPVPALPGALPPALPSWPGAAAHSADDRQ